MSKIKVNTIAPRSGTTVTLGEAGDTIALGACASQTGFGRTGTVDWCTTAKTSPFTAVSGKGYMVNTCGGAVTATLPSSPTAGDIVSIADYKSTWAVACKAVTLGRGGSKINGSCEDSLLNTKGQSVTMVYIDGTQGWKSVQDSTSDVSGTPDFICASGGNATVTCGDYKTHIFTGDGTFTVASISPTAPNNVVEYLIVAGGGTGGTGRGGGGGAGGFRMFASSPGCHSPLNAPAGITVTASPYSIVVGGGGAGQASFPPVAVGSDGEASSGLGLTSAGGGGGGSGPGGTIGQCGGSGGGQAFNNPGGGVGNTPPVSPPQGQNGGTGNPSGAPSPQRGGGGGGGAGGVGGNTGCSGPRGAGGIGSYVPDGFIKTACAPSYGTAGPVSSVRYFAGGGGAGGEAGTGGDSSGGKGPTACGAGYGGGTAGTTTGGGCHATVNSGGASGAAGESTYTGPSSSPTQYTGNGGSGIVMIRYKYQ